MTPIDAGFLLFGLVLMTSLVARRTSIPTPIVFAAVGIAAGAAWHLVPALPDVRMPPDLVLFVFLPPLLTTAAYGLPLEAFRRQLLPIGLLAVGLVVATIGVAAVVGHALAGLPWAAAILLGAILAPPDPVAATAVAGKTGLSQRLVVILEGEGLVNDAVAIVVYSITLEALVLGHFNASGALWSLMREAPLGVAVGWAAGWCAGAIRRRADSVPLEIGISLVAPYLAYHIADRIGGSAVLAVVTLGLLLRASSLKVSLPVARLAARTVWSFLRYASTAIVFLLLGLLLGEISVVWPSRELLMTGGVLASAIIAIRLAWMLAVPRLVARLLRAPRPMPTLGEQLVMGWAGMRGVVSLALALALPLSLGGDGSLRTTIIFLTLVVIVVTLLFQGGTLLPLVKWLGVGDVAREQREEQEARAIAGREGTAVAQETYSREESAKPGTGQTDRHRTLVARIADGQVGIARAGGAGQHPEDRARLVAALEAQRAVVHRLRGAGQMSAALAERLDTELDIEEMSAQAQGARLTDAGE
ncbi:MAG: sodium:proton antiporter [Salinisphaera sp.]|jgi:Na+/H+ antiporter|nr:sodium:proton antiporter [Salinisphaera sp.]